MLLEVGFLMATEKDSKRKLELQKHKPWATRSEPDPALTSPAGQSVVVVSN